MAVPVRIVLAAIEVARRVASRATRSTGHRGRRSRSPTHSCGCRRWPRPPGCCSRGRGAAADGLLDEIVAALVAKRHTGTPAPGCPAATLVWTVAFADPRPTRSSAAEPTRWGEVAQARSAGGRRSRPRPTCSSDRRPRDGGQRSPQGSGAPRELRPGRGAAAARSGGSVLARGWGQGVPAAGRRASPGGQPGRFLSGGARKPPARLTSREVHPARQAIGRCRPGPCADDISADETRNLGRARERAPA